MSEPTVSGAILDVGGRGHRGHLVGRGRTRAGVDTAGGGGQSNNCGP